MTKETYIVEGMSCTACSSSVERVTRRLNGVIEANVNLILKTLYIEYDESILNEIDIFNAVKKAGFSIHKEDSIKNKTSKILKEEGNEEDKTKYPSVKKRLIVSIIFLLPLMYISMGYMIGLNVPSFMSKDSNPLLYAIIELILATPVLIVNRKFFINGFKGIIHLSPNMDTLVGLGSFISYLYGVIAIIIISFGNNELKIKYVNNLYFDSSAMILFLITIGKSLEEKAKMKTSDAVDSLKKLVPKTVFINTDGIIKEIPYSDLKKEDNVIVKPGEIIPIDGIIKEGEAYIDESRISGEPIPKHKEKNDFVVSGSINTDGYLLITAKEVKEDTTLNKIIDLVRNAGASKTNIERLADIISSYFVPIIISLSIVTFILWLIINKEFEPAMYHAIQVLVISCPCALGLATPVAVTASIGACSKSGILIKKADVFEAFNKLDDFVFDKTGTLTIGKPVIKDVVVLNDNKPLLLSIIKSLESKSTHPIAKSIIDYTKDVKELDIENYKNMPGKGVVADYNGKIIMIGNKKLMDENNISVSINKNIGTSLYVSLDNKLIGIVLIEDRIKDESKEVVSYLKNNKIYVSMLSGDSFDSCNKVKDEVGIDIAYDNVLPLDKARIIKEIKESGHVVCFMGDGINDSAALVNSTISMSIKDATDVAMDSSNVILLKNDLRDIKKVIEISKRTVKIIKENLTWAFFYNILMIPIAAGALSFIGINLNPMLASLSMSISSMVVVLNSLRLTKIKGDKNNGKN